MARNFKTVDYEQSLKQTVTIEECLLPDHLARFVVTVIALLDLRHLHAIRPSWWRALRTRDPVGAVVLRIRDGSIQLAQDRKGDL
jgi:hypothetical protein